MADFCGEDFERLVSFFFSTFLGDFDFLVGDFDAPRFLVFPKDFVFLGDDLLFTDLAGEGDFFGVETFFGEGDLPTFDLTRDCFPDATFAGDSDRLDLGEDFSGDALAVGFLDDFTAD